MSNPLSSFMVRGTDEVRESAESSLSDGAFLSSLTSYNPQTSQFLVGQTGELINLPGTGDGAGGFVSGTGKIILQPGPDGCDNGTTENIISGVEGSTEGQFLSGTEKVVWRAGTEVGGTGNLLSGRERVIIQAGGDEGSEGTFLSSNEKVIMQEDSAGGVTQGPLLYLDSTTGLHVLVHHLPNSVQNNVGSQGEDGSAEQFVVVGALQSEEEQAGEVTEQPHHTPLTSHQPLSQGDTCHVTVENMLESHIVAAAGSTSESSISAHQIFEAQLDPMDLHATVSHQETPRGSQKPITTATSLINIQQGANDGISNNTSDTLMDCSETPVLTLQVPEVKSESVEIKEDILKAVPHISLEDIIDKFTSGPQEDVDTNSHCIASSDASFPSITLLKNASLEHQTSSQDPLLQHHRASEDRTLHHQRTSQETRGQHRSVQNMSHYRACQNIVLQHSALDNTTSHHRRTSRETKLQYQKATQDTSQQHKKSRGSHQTPRQPIQGIYSARPLASLSGKSYERSSVRVKVLNDHRDLISHTDIQGREDGSEQDGVDEESLYEVVMTYRCKLCAQVFEEKPALLKHYREVHKPGGTVKIRVTTSDQRKSSLQMPASYPTAAKTSTNTQVASITHKLDTDGQENEAPRELTIISCSFCSKDLLGEREFQEHVNKEHPNESLKKGGRRGGQRHSHGCPPSYPSQPGLLIGHRKARSYTQQDSPEEGKDQSEGRKRRVRAPKTLHEQYWLQKQKVKPVCSDDVEKSHRCPVQPCKYKFSSAENLWLHQQCHGQVDGGDERGFVCPHCSLRFDKWVMCQLHLWKSHSVDVDLLTCGICLTYKTCTHQRLLVHQKTHSDVREHICKVCGKGFRQLAQLLNHQVLHIESPADLPAWKQKGYCSHCQRWLGDKKTLKAHISAVHMKVKPHACPHCFYRCSRKFDLKVHLRQHSGERPYKCELCGWQCSDHNTIRRHKTRHLGLKTLRCPYTFCMFETRHASYFRRHMTRKHPNADVIYKCQICSMETPQVQEYIAHSLIHEKQMISEAISERTGKKSEGGEVVTVDKDTGTKGKGPESVVFNSLNARDSKLKVIPVKLESLQSQGTPSTTKKQSAIKCHYHLEPEIKIEEVSVGESTKVDANASSATVATDETILRMEGQSERLVAIPQVVMAGDGQQYRYIIGISQGEDSTPRHRFFAINK